ncbi:hypothetical protein AC578_1885 [Pseudocercospora eumusae]|uniref:Acyltransferase 3 domain-containing protein n=1 Tax=Pseudocercospora eumusae TaxID=321146 RepID=A0A139H3F9_9PEZI|nr:hypothetical protein AC578_1885 [Pseudocercospora eumusae]
MDTHNGARNLCGSYTTCSAFDDQQTKIRRSSDTAWLDGLRGVAALLVVIQHIHPAVWSLAMCNDVSDNSTATSPGTWPVLRLLFTGGSLAVELFFVISGFVVPRRLISLIQEGRQDDFVEALNSATLSLADSGYAEHARASDVLSYDRHRSELVGTQYAAFFAGMLTCELDLIRTSSEKAQVRLPWSRISHYLAQRRFLRGLVMHTVLALGLIFASTPMAFLLVRHSPRSILGEMAWHPISYFWGAWLTILGIKEIRWAKAIFETTIVQYLGRHSFALYLTHTLVTSTLTRVLLILTNHAFMHGEDAGWPFSAVTLGAWIKYLSLDMGPKGYEPAVLFVLAASLAVIVPLAQIGTRIFDQPSVRIANWMWAKFKQLR